MMHRADLVPAEPGRVVATGASFWMPMPYRTQIGLSVRHRTDDRPQRRFPPLRSPARAWDVDEGSKRQALHLVPR
jgi:hypothetical protein